MMRKNFFALFAVLLGLAAFSGPAFAKPNFVGTWKLVADKSDYGPLPMPEKLEHVIEEKGPDLKVSVTSVGPQGEFKGDLKYNTEGQETANDLRGNPMKSKAKYDGEALLIDTKLDFQGNEITLTDKWTLSEDGKTLTIARKLNSAQGELEQKIVMTKE